MNPKYLVAEIEAGTVELIPWEEVRAEFPLRLDHYAGYKTELATDLLKL